MSLKQTVILLVLFLLLSWLFLFRDKLLKPNVLSVQAKTYTIILVGDSMTAALGTNTPELKQDLKKYYPNVNFEISNYSVGSTNLQSAKDRLENQVEVEGQSYPPILQQNFDLIIIESFGHNPLSHLALDEGLKTQNKILDDIITKIKSSHPKASIVFLATIAPNRNHYAENTVVLTPEQRHQWADERTAYIKNHIEYANSHQIPLIDVYNKSLKDDSGNIDYINSADFIHPSPIGVILISQEIADFIGKKQKL